MRIGGFFLGVLALAFVAWAGKPGGGGGPAPAGVIYFSKVVREPFSIQGGSILPDGTGEQALAGAGERPPSYALHGGKRWFLDTELDDSLRNPRTNVPTQRIVAVREDGVNVVLVPNGADWMPGADNGGLGWAKDDSFFSYTAIVWHGSGVYDAKSFIFRADLAWDSGGQPSVVGSPAVVLERPELDQQGTPVSAIHTCDWEPGAGRLVYQYQSASMPRIELRVYNVGSGSDTFLAEGIWPEWAPDGIRIAYESPYLAGSIRLVDPDVSGSDIALLTEPAKKAYGGPHWSPDSAHICLASTSWTSGVNYVWWSSIVRIPAAGGTLTMVKEGTKDGPSYGAQGWR